MIERFNIKTKTWENGEIKPRPRKPNLDDIDKIVDKKTAEIVMSEGDFVEVHRTLTAKEKTDIEALFT